MSGRGTGGLGLGANLEKRQQAKEAARAAREAAREAKRREAEMKKKAAAEARANRINKPKNRSYAMLPESWVDQQRQQALQGNNNNNNIANAKATIRAGIQMINNGLNQL